MSIQYTADQLQRKFQGPPGASGFARIAEVLREEGRHEEALALLQEGLKGKPGHLTGHLVLGKCYFDMERLDEAREQFETVLRQDSRCLSAMHHLARIMVKLQWQEAAAAYYRSILELEPWDTEILERFREANPGAAGFSPAPAAAAPIAPMAAPLAPAEVAVDLAAEPPAVEEFDLNKVADFLPAESNPSELAGALQEVSLEDALSAPPSESRAAFPPAEALSDPQPMDVLAAAQAAPAVESPAESGEAPAPISGDDVGDRLDDLFGADDQPMAQAPAPAADAAPDADFADATLQLKAMRQEPAPEAGEATSFSASPAEPSPTAPDPRNAGLAELAEGGNAPEDRISGDDIEQRLDDLFSLTEETRFRPVQKSAVAEPPIGEATVIEPPAEPMADATASVAAEPAEPVGAAPADAFPDDAVPESADLPDAEPPRPALASFETDTILAPESGIGSGMSPDEVVTGQDVADKLEALFGNEPPPRGPKPLRDEAVELPASGSASWAAARPLDEALPTPAEPGSDTAETPALPEEASAGNRPADTWVESLEPAPPPTSDLMSTESMLPRGIGMSSAPPITGEDIEDRLDSLFNIGDDSPPAGPEAAFAEPAAEAPDVEAPAGIEPAAFPAPESIAGSDNDRTVMMPAMKEGGGDWLARQAEAADAAPAPEMPLPPVMPSAAAPGGGDTMILANEDVFAPEAPVGMPGGADTVGMEMVDGSDIAERLDQIFAPEDAPAAAAKAAADAAIARGEATPEGSPILPLSEAEATLPLVEEEPRTADLSVETGEMPIDEVALFAKDPEATLELPESPESSAAGTMVSGEDVKTRLSELFEEPTALPAPAYDAGADEPVVEVFPEPTAWIAGSPDGEAQETSEEMPAADKPFRPAKPAADQPAGEMPPVSPVAGRPAPVLAPLMDEEEGSPEEEESGPQSAAGTNVATVTLAEIYFQQGLREQALQIYRQLLEREPGNESVRKRIQEIEASKPEAGPGAGADPRRPRPGLKVPKRKK